MKIQFELTVREAVAVAALLEHGFGKDEVMLEYMQDRHWIRAADRAYAKLRDAISDVNGFLQ